MKNLSTDPVNILENVRVRFAPSPTGPLHIGGVRTAWYNYLFAKQQKGRFILRIEDTDKKRWVPESEDYIEQALAWLSIAPDEGPKQGGDFGPYRQSERKVLYKKYALQLVEKGYAYYAFDTPQALAKMRERQKEFGKEAGSYNAITRMSMKNSITLPASEVDRRVQNGNYVIRLRVPRQRKIKFHDTVRGWVVAPSASLDDKVLLKEDGMPTYHLANVVDDRLMKISHVIRGEEWLPSMPIHWLIYEGLGWPPPVFVHLPLLLRKDGQGKLSKRDTATEGIPIFPINWYDKTQKKMFQGFREAGFLPEALLNFLSLLGWHPHGHKELLSYEELLKSFSLDRIRKGSMRVDLMKATWFNQRYLQALPSKVLAQRYLLPTLAKENISTSQAYATAVCHVAKQHVSFPQDLWEKHQFFFKKPDLPSQAAMAGKWNPGVKSLFHSIENKIKQLGNYTPQTIKSMIKTLAEAQQLPLRRLLPLLRIALTGNTLGPDLMQIIACLGKEEVIARLGDASKAWG